MIIRYLPLLISLLFVIINADENKDQQSAISINKKLQFRNIMFVY